MSQPADFTPAEAVTPAPSLAHAINVLLEVHCPGPDFVVMMGAVPTGWTFEHYSDAWATLWQWREYAKTIAAAHARPSRVEISGPNAAEIEAVAKRLQQLGDGLSPKPLEEAMQAAWAANCDAAHLLSPQWPLDRSEINWNHRLRAQWLEWTRRAVEAYLRAVR